MVHCGCLESIPDLESRGCFRVWGSFGTLAIQLGKCSQKPQNTSTSCCHCCERSLFSVLVVDIVTVVAAAVQCCRCYCCGLHWRCCGCSGGSSGSGGGWGRLCRCGCCWQQATTEQVSHPSAPSIIPSSSRSSLNLPQVVDRIFPLISFAWVKRGWDRLQKGMGTEVCVFILYII